MNRIKRSYASFPSRTLETQNLRIETCVECRLNAYDLGTCNVIKPICVNLDYFYSEHRKCKIYSVPKMYKTS